MVAVEFRPAHVSGATRETCSMAATYVTHRARDPVPNGLCVNDEGRHAVTRTQAPARSPRELPISGFGL